MTEYSQNDLIIKSKINEFFTNGIFDSYLDTDHLIIDLNKHNVNLYFIISKNDIVVYESFPNEENIITQEEDLYKIIKNPARILRFESKTEFTEVYNYLKHYN